MVTYHRKSSSLLDLVILTCGTDTDTETSLFGTPIETHNIFSAANIFNVKLTIKLALTNRKATASTFSNRIPYHHLAYSSDFFDCFFSLFQVVRCFFKYFCELLIA